MDTTDIDPSASPSEERCTAQTFELPPDEYALGDPRLQSGSPLRLSHTPDWPPAFLFDGVYAGSVFHNFGTQELKDMVNKRWKASYAGGSITTADAGHEVIIGQQPATMKGMPDPPQERLEAHRECRRAHHGIFHVL